MSMHQSKGTTTEGGQGVGKGVGIGVEWGSGPPKIWTEHPNFFDEEYDYRYVTDCSARNWVYHP